MGTTADKLSYLNTTKAKIKESINLTNINITNEPFRYYAYAIKKGIINVLNNPKEIWNNFEKVTGEGTSIELTSTENAPIEINLKGNLSQSGDPTPTDPVEINVVSGDNEIKVENKNLFDDSVAINDCSVNNGIITITTNTTDVYIQGAYVYSEANKFLTLPSGNYYLKSTNPNVRVTFYGGNASLDTVNQQPITLASETNFGGIRIRSSNSLQNVTFGIMLSTTNDTFEPYQSTTYPISLGDIELCKIGNYQDYIYKEDDKWYLKKRIGKKVLDGSENWSGSSFGEYFRTYISISDILVSSANSINLYSNYFYGSLNALNSSNAQIGMMAQFRETTNVYFIGNASNVGDFKNWLSTHNTIVYYVLATPTNTEITDSTLIYQLEKTLYSYSGQTNISQTNNDLPFILDVKALKLIE